MDFPAWRKALKEIDWRGGIISHSISMMLDKDCGISVAPRVSLNDTKTGNALKFIPVMSIDMTSYCPVHMHHINAMLSDQHFLIQQSICMRQSMMLMTLQQVSATIGCPLAEIEEAWMLDIAECGGDKICRTAVPMPSSAASFTSLASSDMTLVYKHETIESLAMSYDLRLD